jgi:hypothetical protein
MSKFFMSKFSMSKFFMSKFSMSKFFVSKFSQHDLRRKPCMCTLHRSCKTLDRNTYMDPS